MMDLFRRILSFVVSLVVTLGVVALFVALNSTCPVSLVDLIPGKWQRYEMNDAKPLFFYPRVIEFFKDGTVSMTGEMGVSSEVSTPLTVLGNFKFIDEKQKHLRIDPSGTTALLLKSIVVEVRALRGAILQMPDAEDELILTFPQGEIAKYKRMKGTFHKKFYYRFCLDGSKVLPALLCGIQQVLMNVETL